MTIDGLGEDELRSEINVTPLVDVMLVLLVIFMVVTPLLHLQLPVDLPEARTSEEPATTTSQMHLTMGADGTLRLNDVLVAPADLEQALRAALADRTDRTIFLEADRALTYAAVVDVIDRCRIAGIERIGVLTRPLAPPAA